MVFLMIIYSDSTYREAVKDKLKRDKLKRVSIENPDLKIYNLFGHNHRPTIQSYTTGIKNVFAYSIPPIVDYLAGFYVVASIHNNVTFEKKELVYSLEIKRRQNYFANDL